MVYLRIRDIKTFMNRLLTQEDFDGFLCGRMQVQSDKGVLTIENNKGYEPICYGRLRSTLFDFIKGKQLPDKISIQLLADETMLSEAFGENRDEVGTASVLIGFKETELTMSSGVLLKGFSTDKTLEKQWDGYVVSYAEKLDIPYENMI